MDPPNDEDGVGGIICASLEMEMGSRGHQVKLEEAGTVAMQRSEVQVKAGNLEGAEDETVLELDRLVKNLHVNGDPQGMATKKVELLSKLEEARVETADRMKALRRMEWKEEVRKEMLRREEVKSKMGSVPLEQVTDWKAKADMSRISMEWREAFKDERNNFLIDEVFQILLETCSGYSRDEVVLSSRPVSSAWKSSVEACLLSRFEYGLPEIRDINICVPQFCGKGILNYFNYWSDHHYSGENPFFSRKIAINGGIVEWRNNLEFWEGGELLLRRWGQEIWVLVIRFDKGMTFEAMYEQLLKYLKLTPNLQCLVIMDHPRRGSNAPLVTDMMRDLGKDIYGSLKLQMGRNPLPDLPNLKHIQFQDCIVAPLAQAMFAKYSASLEDVFMDDSELGEAVDPRELLTGRDLTLPHLKDLLVTSFTPPGTLDLSRNCPSLEVLIMTQREMKDAADVLSFFDNLNCLKHIPTLRQLTLGVQPSNRAKMLKLSEVELKGLSLDLPQLKILKILVTHINLKNVDYLLPCVSLKELKVTFHKFKTIDLLRDRKKVSNYDDDKETEIKDAAASAVPSPPRPPNELIQFFQYTNRLYESNLWKLLPELRRVTITVINSVVKLDSAGLTEVGTAKSKVKVYNRGGLQEARG